VGDKSKQNRSNHPRSGQSFRHHSQHPTCADLGDEEILERLLALNLERAAA